MDIPVTQLPPGDPRLVEAIVGQLKSRGIFDQFRKECLADVDTKPAFQNLRQRVEGHVNKFLEKKTWKNDLNKNQLRDGVRKHVNNLGILDTGIDAIITQVVNPKIKPLILPYVEDTVYAFLQIDKPKRERQDSEPHISPVPQEEEIKMKIEEPPPKEVVKVEPSLLPMETDVISSEEDDILARESPEASHKSTSPEVDVVVKTEDENAQDGFESCPQFQEDNPESLVTNVEQLHLSEDDSKSTQAAKPPLPLFEDQSLDSISSNSSGLTFSPLTEKGSPESKKSQENGGKSDESPRAEMRSTTSTPLVDEKPVDETSQSSFGSDPSKEFQSSDKMYPADSVQGDHETSTPSLLALQSSARSGKDGASFMSVDEDSRESKESFSKMSMTSEKSEVEEKAKSEKSEGEITSSSSEFSDGDTKIKQEPMMSGEKQHSDHDSSHKSSRSKSEHKKRHDSYSRERDREREKEKDSRHHRDKERKHSKSRDDHHSHRDKDKKHHRRDKDHDGDRERSRGHHHQSSSSHKESSGSSRTSGDKDKDRSSHHSSGKSSEGKSRSSHSSEKSDSKPSNKMETKSDEKSDGKSHKKDESKHDKKHHGTSDRKSDSKSEGKREKRSEDRTDKKSDKKPERKLEKKEHSDVKQEKKSEGKSDSKNTEKSGIKSEGKESKTEDKPEVKKEKTKEGTEIKSENKVAGKTDGKSKKKTEEGNNNKYEEESNKLESDLSSKHRKHESRQNSNSKKHKRSHRYKDDSEMYQLDSLDGNQNDCKDTQDKEKYNSEIKNGVFETINNDTSEHNGESQIDAHMLGLNGDNIIVADDEGNFMLLTYEDDTDSVSSDSQIAVKIDDNFVFEVPSESKETVCQNDFEGFENTKADQRLADYLLNVVKVPDEMDMECSEWFDESDLHITLYGDTLDGKIPLSDFLKCVHQLGAVIRNEKGEIEDHSVTTVTPSVVEAKEINAPPVSKKRRISNSSSISSSSSSTGSPKHKRLRRESSAASDTSQMMEQDSVIVSGYALLTPEDDGNRTMSREYDLDYSQKIANYSPLSPASDSSADEGKAKNRGTAVESRVGIVKSPTKIDQKTDTSWSNEEAKFSV